MRGAAWALVAAAMLATVEPLALKRRGGLTKSKKKKKLKKAPAAVAPPPVAPAPRAPLSWSLSPEEHMAAVSNAVESAADGIQTALADGDFFARTNFLDARSVAASAQIMPTTPSTRHLLDGVHPTHCLICAQVAAMAEEARRLDGTLVPSQSTRYEAGQTIAYDKEGVRSTQILGGNDYDKAPRLTEYVVSLTAALSSVAGQVRPLSPQRQTNKLAVCDAVGASYPKHIDNGGGAASA